MDVAEMLEKRAFVEQVLTTISSGLQDVRIVFELVETLMTDRTMITDFLDMMLVWYRDMYLLRAQGDPHLVANSDAIARLQNVARTLTSPQIQRLFEIVYQTKLDILRNANLQLTLEVMLISLIEVYNDRIRWR